MNGLKWIALSLLTVSVSAASEHLVLRLDSGDETFPLAEIGKVTFSDNALSVHVDGRVCQYDFAEIEKLFFGDGQGTVAELNADGLLFRCEGGAVRVDGLASPVSAFVVDMSGRILIAEAVGTEVRFVWICCLTAFMSCCAAMLPLNLLYKPTK